MKNDERILELYEKDPEKIIILLKNNSLEILKETELFNRIDLEIFENYDIEKIFDLWKTFEKTENGNTFYLNFLFNNLDKNKFEKILLDKYKIIENFINNNRDRDTFLNELNNLLTLDLIDINAFLDLRNESENTDFIDYMLNKKFNFIEEILKYSQNPIWIAKILSLKDNENNSLKKILEEVEPKTFIAFINNEKNRGLLEKYLK